jgi:MFS family permease
MDDRNWYDRRGLSGSYYLVMETQQKIFWMLFAGIILHGVCFDFFFVTGQIYTDSKADIKIQSSAQGLITMATYGVGMWIGTLLSGYVKDYYTVDKIVTWKSVWLVPAVFGSCTPILFDLFNEKRKSVQPSVNM